METRGWKLCVCFGLLSVALAKDASQSVPGAKEDESTFTEFTLVSDSKSHLFSSCFAELNTVEATLQAIEVDEGKEYIRYLIDSDAEVTWEDVEGVDDTITCAFKAYEAGGEMFKYSNGVCSIATEGLYNPAHASCDGEEVFIIDPPNACFTSLGMEIAGHQYYSWLCETNCDSSGMLIDEEGSYVSLSIIPTEVAACCSTDTTPCLHTKNVKDLPCVADRYCYFLGMMLPSAVPGETLNQFKQYFDSAEDPSEVYILVNVRYESDGYYHFPGKVPVNSDEWESGAVPKAVGFVVLNENLKLDIAGDNDSLFVVCQEREKLPACSK